MADDPGQNEVCRGMRENRGGTFWIVEFVQGVVTAKRNFGSDLSGCG